MLSSGAVGRDAVPGLLSLPYLWKRNRMKLLPVKSSDSFLSFSDFGARGDEHDHYQVTLTPYLLYPDLGLGLM